RVLEHLGLQVSRLLRTAYGPLVLDDLPKGATDEVRRDMLERFQASLRKTGGRGGEALTPSGDVPAPVPADEPPTAYSKPVPPALPKGERRAPSYGEAARPRPQGRG